MRSDRALLPLALLGLAACEIEKAAIPPTTSRLALHGVLSATATSQVFLLERTRNGTVELFAPPFDQYPQVTDEGIAEQNASAQLVTPAGEVLFATEDRLTRGDGRGEGIYRFPLAGSALQRGGRYVLHVRTAQGESLLADAEVPDGDAVVTATPRTFDRARDTIALAWPATPGARAYLVRIESPFGPHAFFTDGTRVRLTGALRNVDARALPRVFVPGFQQAVTVTAVDANYYDWYRTSNNVFTGSGVINRIQGGIGVFGSTVRVQFEDVHVVAPQPEPAAGRFVWVGPPEEAVGTPFLGMELYVEARAARDDQPDALSGRVFVRPRFGYTGCLTCGALGTTKDGRIRIAFLSDWSARDTMEILDGEIRGDTIVGGYRGFGGIVRFVKQR